ncbi:MAG: GH25 family lysozyme [Eggerthellaceae bacterium]|nr:GH25 family lysozyme [Eggerthellaceae bacterium]
MAQHASQTKKPHRVLKAILLIIAILAVVLAVLVGLVKARVINPNEPFLRNGIQGVDISEYQVDVDMDTLKSQGIEFIFIKATEGSSHVDSRFAENWANAQASGLPAGAYHFFSFDSPGATQAANFIATVPAYDGMLIPVVDVEWYADKKSNQPAKEDVIRELSAFMDAIEAAYGVQPMIYTGSDLWKDFLKDSFGEHRLWASSLYSPYWLSWGNEWSVLQYSGRGELEGYKSFEGFIDLDVLASNVSLDDLRVK